MAVYLVKLKHEFNDFNFKFMDFFEASEFIQSILNHSEEGTIVSIEIANDLS